MNYKHLIKRRTLLLSGIAASTTAAIAISSRANQPKNSEQAQFRWRMVSRWDKNFPDQFTAAQRLANRINVLSEGRLAIEVLLPGQVVKSDQTLNAVTNGTIEMYRGLSYDWRNQSENFDFFTVMPFGLTQNEMTAWLYYFGGQQLWDKMYAAFGVKPFPAGSLGAQSFGWFRNEIRNVADIKGLRFRTTGLGQNIMSKLGATPVRMGVKEIMQSMQAGTLDGFELVGPLADLHFGFHKVAPYYYFPSYNQPAGMIELIVNKKSYDALPKDLRQVIETAAQAEHDQGLAEANAGNAKALSVLIKEHQVQVRQLPQDVLTSLGKASGEVLVDIRNSGDSLTKQTLDSFLKAREVLTAWSQTSEQSFLNARVLPFTYG